MIAERYHKRPAADYYSCSLPAYETQKDELFLILIVDLNLVLSMWAEEKRTLTVR